MWDEFLIAHRGWSRACLVLLGCASFTPGVPPSAQAHSILSEFIQHGVQLTVGAQHVDVTVDLTFFEEWSVREREAMDADGSGDITRAEIENYRKRLAPQLARQVKLRAAGRELALVPLYEPEIDLLGDNQVGPAHHRLRLFWFAPTPELRAGDELVIESGLWPEAQTLATPQGEGRDGCKLTALISVDAGLTHARSQGEVSPNPSSRFEPLNRSRRREEAVRVGHQANPPPHVGGYQRQVQGEKRWFKFRCLQPPAKTSQAASNSNRSSLATAQPASSPGQLKPSATQPEP